MLDTDTFLTQLYCTVDDFCQSQLAPEPRLGHPPSLSRSEVVTLAVFSQWFQFGSERGFYRFARRQLRRAFPHLPDRAQFNRLVRQQRPTLIAFFLDLAASLQPQPASYEALDATAVPTRDRRRRGMGWLPEFVDIGPSSRLQWFAGLRLLVSVNPQGVITGYGFGSASAKDQPLAETFLAARAFGHPELAMVGAKPEGVYLTDKGFEGEACHFRWRADYGAEVLTPPKRQNRRQWPQAVRRQLASLRQIVETVFAKLHHPFRLGAERPHDLAGFATRLAAKLALHNFCIWLNRQLGRPDLAFCDLWAW
jgi:hypothetical protein